jgi:tetratricopeptide (TPR) repeat protein
VAGLVLGIGSLAALAGAWRTREGWPQAAAVWTCCALLGQALGGDALLDPLGLACFAVAAGFSLSVDAVPRLPKASPGRAALALGLLGIGIPLIILQALQTCAFAHAHLRREEGMIRQGQGDARGAQEAWTLAEASYRKAAQGAIPSHLDLDARFHQGACLMRLGRPEEALGIYRDLLARGGPYGNARREAGRAALLAGDLPLARGWLEGHLAYAPCDVEAYPLLLAAAPEASGRLVSAFWDASARVPDSHPMLAEGAFWRSEVSDWEGAWRLSLRALRARPRPDLAEIALVSGLRAGHAPQALALARDFPRETLRALRDGIEARVREDPAASVPRGIRALLRLVEGDRAGARQDLDAIPAGQERDTWGTSLESLLSGAG